MNNYSLDYLPKDILLRLGIFLNFHERSCIFDIPCAICVNYKHIKTLDKDINENLIKNYCKIDKSVNNIKIDKLTSIAQRIHVIGNHWSLINNLKHRKFKFICGKKEQCNFNNDDSVCITDITYPIEKLSSKLIVTQGYENNYDLQSVDYLLIEKKYIDNSIQIPFDKQIIPEKGFLVINMTNLEKFYTG